MPYMTDGKRDYKKQQKYDSKPEVIDYRAKLVQVQRDLEKEGRAKKGDGLDNAHKKAHSKGGSAKLSNIKPTNPASNRSFSRNSDSSMKSEKSRKGK
jgi:hypothetical protein